MDVLEQGGPRTKGVCDNSSNRRKPILIHTYAYIYAYAYTVPSFLFVVDIVVWSQTAVD